jgi:hypothetical protein
MNLKPIRINFFCRFQLYIDTLQGCVYDTKSKKQYYKQYFYGNKVSLNFWDKLLYNQIYRRLLIYFSKHG